MEWHTVSRLSPHCDETAEGYVIYRDVPIARTGTQIYWENEVPPLAGDAGGRVHVARDAEDVFHPDSIKSFNGKPLVDDHPWEPVGPDNWNDLVIGYVSNVRRGDGVRDELLLADLMFTSRKGIEAVRRGKRAISVGYNAAYEQDMPGTGRQRDIFCNHVALVDEGRCGSRCVIMDGKPLWLSDAEFIEAEHPRDEDGKFTFGGGGGGGAGGGVSGGSGEAGGSETFSKNKPPPDQLHGVPFYKWQAPQHAHEWEALAQEGADFTEPEFKATPGKKTGAGVIIQEADGRVWIVHPTDGFGGYKATFPKGGVDDGMTQKGTALKEAYEESGLKVELTGFAGDVERSTSKARYYYAKRVGGTPTEHGWESEGVTLAPVEDLKAHLNHPTDHEMVDKFLAQPNAVPLEPITKTPLSEQANESGTVHPSVANWKKVGPQKGSNPGAQMEDETGLKHYVKFQKSDAHAQNEVLASRLYEAAEAPALQSKLVDIGNGKLGTATQWKEGVQLIDPNKASDRSIASENFAAHAWLANWDAAGLSYDNQGWHNGELHTLDTGGSLLFRAQGDPKGAAFGNDVTEWDSLRSPKNAQAHKLFGGMTDEQLTESAKRIASIPDDKIKALVDEHGPGTASDKADLTAKLIARRDDIAAKAGLGADVEPVKAQAELTAAVPDPPSWLSNSGKKVQAAVKEGIKNGESPDAIAEKIKTAALLHSHPNSATYANNMLKLVEAHHGLKTGSLGKAVPKGKGGSSPPAPSAMPAPSGTAPTLAPTPQAAPPVTPKAAPAQAAGAFPEPDDNSYSQKGLKEDIEGHTGTLAEKIAYAEGEAASLNAPENKAYANAIIAHLKQQQAAAPTPGPVSGPDPATNSNKQAEIFQIAQHPTETHAEKIEKIKAIAAVANPGGTTEAFANEYLKAMGAQPASAAAPPKKATPQVSSPTATQTASTPVSTAFKNPHGLTKVPHHYHEGKVKLEDAEGKKLVSKLAIDTERIPSTFYHDITAAYGDKPHEGKTAAVGEAMQKAADHAKADMSKPELSAVTSHKGNGYHNINNTVLAGGTNPQIQKLRAVMKRNVIPANTPVHRGLSTTLKKLSGFDDPELSVGRAFVHKNFASMSRSVETAESFGALHHEGTPTTMMHVTIPAGAPGLVLAGSTGYDQHGGEREIVMPDHSVFRIDKVEATGATGIKHHIYCTYMGTEEGHA